MIHAIHTDKQHPDGGQVSWVGQCGAEVVDDSSMVAATDLLKLGEFTGAGGSRIPLLRVHGGAGPYPVGLQG